MLTWWRPRFTPLFYSLVVAPHHCSFGGRGGGIQANHAPHSRRCYKSPCASVHVYSPARDRRVAAQRRRLEPETCHCCGTVRSKKVTCGAPAKDTDCETSGIHNKLCKKCAVCTFRQKKKKK